MISPAEQSYEKLCTGRRERRGEREEGQRKVEDIGERGRREREVKEM